MCDKSSKGRERKRKRKKRREGEKEEIPNETLISRKMQVSVYS